ncbi:MAG: thiamine pyrophosphate-dependent enzyme [Erysipelotrichaceae bacterium]
MNTIYKRSEGLTDKPLTYCPGCTHGIIQRLVAEVLVELGILDHTIVIASVGCSVMAYDFYNTDAIQAAHGRAPAVATGVKRAQSDKIVFTYQGDGDLASIGMAEIVHAAHRGENITVIFVNNAIYGMTGGQMAPTTLLNQKTTTSPLGRNQNGMGLPLQMCELLATVPSAAFLQRVSVHNPAHVTLAKKAIKRAFENQIQQKGFSLVEVLSTCNVGWGCTPLEALEYVKNQMIEYYPLGIFKEDDQ